MPAGTSDELAIDLHDVTKVYKGRVHALQGIEMQVRRGEVFGLLGPNGAGKSTLVKIMMSVVRPTRVAGTILGQPVAHKATLARVGYLPENHRFPRYLTGRQICEFFAALAKVDRPTRKRRAAELIEVVGMSGAADRKIATYSKGMAQRIGLAQAMMNDPDLIVLDEPTDGVDPQGRKDIRDVLSRLKSQGKTVFVNSHLLSELEMVSDRVAILVGGRVARQGTIDEMTVAKQRYEIEFLPDAAKTPALQSALGEFFGGQRLPNLAVPAPVAPAIMPQSMAPPMMPPAMPSGYPPAGAAPPPQGLPPLPYATPPAHQSVTGTSPAPLATLRGKLPDGKWVELQGAVLRVGSTEANDVQFLLDELRRAGLTIRRVQLIRPTLEELFIDVMAEPGASVPPAANRGVA